MITIQHKETEKNGIFEAWMRATEEGACTEPLQVGEMTYQRPTSSLMIVCAKHSDRPECANL